MDGNLFAGPARPLSANTVQLSHPGRGRISKNAEALVWSFIMKRERPRTEPPLL